jgi:hypothetical protein
VRSAVCDISDAYLRNAVLAAAIPRSILTKSEDRTRCRLAITEKSEYRLNIANAVASGESHSLADERKLIADG